MKKNMRHPLGTIGQLKKMRNDNYWSIGTIGQLKILAVDDK